MSPTRGHGRLAMRLAFALDRRSDGRGQAAVEWRFRLQPPGEARRPLVPDVAYLSNARLRGLDFDAAEAPAFGPDVAIEILSANERADRIASKIAVYFACETQLAALPGFSLELAALFSALDLPR